LWYGATAGDAAAIGFDDSHIQRQIEQPEERRLLPHSQLLREEALAVFHLWQESGLRVDY
jgi:hypothetical protein